ncbi:MULTISPECIES: recombinase family protein [Clostridium]|uniref:recombinase family protein n=1 Tax=Clostridium TaxID=1485 RepID=UPI0006C207BF|nr:MULTISPECIES: recombinase family protein [Clostridium]CUP10618.1 resolvase site-specific recombinase [Clostridium disporicum]SCK00199.1 Recombinase [uncultured Clostridium sp.]
MGKVAYCRVSDKKGIDSFENQKQYFNEFGVEKLYTDFDISGMSLKHRQGFIEMLRDAGLNVTKIDDAKMNYKLVVTTSDREPKFNHIYIKSTSRFSRNSAEAMDIIRCLSSKGVYVTFLDLNKSTKEEGIDMVLSILFTINNEESLAISKRTRWGNAVTASNGVFRAFNLYGYTKKEDKVEIVEEEAEIIKLIYKLRIEENIGSRKIAKEINKLGYRTRKNEEWSANSVMNILTNEAYTGKIIRNKYHCDTLYGNNKRTLKPKEEWVITEAPELRIISDNDWGKAEKLIKSATNENKRGINNGSNIYRDKIKCAKCGSNYTINISSTGRQFYNCNKKKKYGLKECSSRNIDLSKIDEIIENYVGKGYKINSEKIVKEFMEPMISGIINNLKSNYDKNNDKKIEDNMKRLNELQIQSSRIMDLYLIGTFDKKMVEIKGLEVKEEIDKLIKENNELSKGNSLIDKKINYIETLMNFIYSQLENIAEDISKEEFINKYLHSIIIDDNNYIVFTLFNKALEMIVKLTSLEDIENFDEEAKKLLDMELTL